MSNHLHALALLIFLQVRRLLKCTAIGIAYCYWLKLQFQLQIALATVLAIADVGRASVYSDADGPIQPCHIRGGSFLRLLRKALMPKLLSEVICSVFSRSMNENGTWVPT